MIIRRESEQSREMHGVLGGLVNACLAFVPARVTVRKKVRQEITDSFWKESRLRMACACGAVGPKVTFWFWQRNGRNNDSNTWVSGYRMQSAEFKNRVRHIDPLRHGLTESFKPGLKVSCAPASPSANIVFGSLCVGLEPEDDDPSFSSVASDQ